MRIVDANVLLYAVNVAAPRHAQARSWLDGALAGREPIGFAWTVLLAFLRLATHPAVFPRPLTASEATDVVRAWLAQPPATVVEPTPRHADLLAGLLAEAGTAANLVGDAHLAALAIEHGAVLVSYDADFGRFAGLRREVPGA
ncbi:MAG: type II toxin-antitoxin system VapC family toxin [Chloroflexota bacterium]